ncbi:O-acetyl-ADP-ribose deacetylase [Ligilactobacillus acidipiscis]|jgi:O-acetyl-ADP-ribose deacetylase (regulator of RNase III)|uniref:O-acetyl-ADP-ribose deacetylase n=1 Tax=Ligilactobacillus acidipiscis TaxID=89059 RepID=UPI0029F632BE|nr:O-acetyl-ADP-ribose deacetylase [Ligilactobacillus acidipiscis]MCI1954650.1 O-acetyl-ADP-ribose deacetylase [Ligilactobacillus acidipiscis]
MTKITIIQGDITVQKVDAIVNAANTSLRGGGGVDGAIHRAAGTKLDKACQRLGGCLTGEAKTTSGFNLPAKYIIHTPGPIWRGGNNNEEQLLQNCYQNCVLEADKHQCHSIAFPSISTGVYGFPLKKAAQIALQTLIKSNSSLYITFVCFDQQTYRVYQETLAALLN